MIAEDELDEEIRIAKESLVLFCKFCNGKGHIAASCGTLHNLDRVMKAHPTLRDEWILQKFKKIDYEYHKQKEERKRKLDKVVKMKRLRTDQDIEMLKSKKRLKISNSEYKEENAMYISK